ncbi:FAD/NAD(P)-binding oxidoreductase [Rhizobium sp. Root708]|uniref:FAD-dependent oxidoreductase n=1 Tax=Rhizobium sp. Root708 TaxID=1736592 RepID=UPI0006F59B50|nr:FAD-dependent oxidoreductase [Rhizobium sp. Root708]KRB49196.1 FAD/NAD(P)-binding oxidoreductase [Rhizobium sp. Root708]
MSRPDLIVIVGAGPAGVSAASILVEAGHRPVLIDEGMSQGGQVFRRPPDTLQRTDRQLYGFDAARARSMRDSFARIQPSLTYLPETLIWNVEPGMLHLSGTAGITRQPWHRLIVAPGAMDRIVPVKGWTAPGVFTLGGAQIALKAQASLIGHETAFLGSGPLLYLVAYQYARAGGRVAAVLETGAPFHRLPPIAGLAAGGRILAKGLYYIAWLKARGVPLHAGVEPLEIMRAESGRVSGLRYRVGKREASLACDAVGMGQGLKSETQLADLLGVDFHFSEQHRQWLPTVDQDGRSSIDGVYLAGDGLAIRGSEVAEMTGELAALALLADCGKPDTARSAKLRRRIARMDRFRRALDKLFPFPRRMPSDLSDDTLICRCEGLTARSVREAVAVSGETDINRIKAFSRLGMGRCQGRVCAPAAAELVAAQAAVDVRAVGRMRGQAPVKPIPLCMLAGGVDDSL